MVKAFRNIYACLKKRWNRIIIAFILALLIISIVFRPLHPAHKLFLEYLNRILSWPTVVFILVIFFCLLFRKQISLLLEKISEIGFGKASVRLDQKPIEKHFDKQMREASLQVRDKPNAASGEKLPEKFEDIPKIYQELAKTYVEWILFERLIRWMYRSQFELLRALVAKGTMSVAETSQFYNIYLKRGGNPNYTKDAYFGWLLNVNLIQLNESDKTIIIPKEEGKKFIDYFYMNRYPESEFRDL